MKIIIDEGLNVADEDKIAMGCTQYRLYWIPLGGLYDSTLKQQGNKWRKNTNSWLCSDLLSWLLWVAADFCVFCLHTVDAHHRGINERKNTLKEMFIFIWPELKLCKFVEGTNRANLLQIQLGCSAVVQKIKERRKRLIKTNAMH